MNIDYKYMMSLHGLGDIIESLGGAILVDSAVNTHVVFKSSMGLFWPFETLTVNPIRELIELHVKI